MKKAISLINSISLSTRLQAQDLFTNEQQLVQQTIIKLFDALSNQ